MTSDGKAPVMISIENIHATVWPIGVHFKNVSIQQFSSDSTVMDSLFIQKITLQHFNPISFLFQKKYNIGNITLDHLTSVWTLPAADTSKAEIVIPFHSTCQTLTFKSVSLTLKKKNSSQQTNVENGNLVLKSVLLQKDSLLSSINYQIHDVNFAAFNYFSSDSLYTFRADHLLYSAGDSTIHVDSFFSIPTLENYAFARMQPYQTDRIYAAFKNITIKQCDLKAMISTGDLDISSIYADTFLLDIFRDRRRPFLHKKRPLFQDLLFSYPGVLSIDSINAHHGKIKYTEHDINASKPGVIWFSDVTAMIKHLYNDTTTVVRPNDTLIVAAQALAMGKGKIQFESKGKLSDPLNTFVTTGLLENIPFAAFNPILVQNASIAALDGHLDGIYFNFIADKTIAHGDLIFRYQDLHLLKVDAETNSSKGFKNRVITSVLNRKILDHNPLPDDTLRYATIHFERDPEKMYFSYMLKSIFSGIKETVMK